MNSIATTIVGLSSYKFQLLLQDFTTYALAQKFGKQWIEYFCRNNDWLLITVSGHKNTSAPHLAFSKSHDVFSEYYLGTMSSKSKKESFIYNTRETKGDIETYTWIMTTKELLNMDYFAINIKGYIYNRAEYDIGYLDKRTKYYDFFNGKGTIEAIHIDHIQYSTGINICYEEPPQTPWDFNHYINDLKHLEEKSYSRDQFKVFKANLKRYFDKDSKNRKYRLKKKSDLVKKINSALKEMSA